MFACMNSPVGKFLGFLLTLTISRPLRGQEREGTERGRQISLSKTSNLPDAPSPIRERGRG